MNLPPYVRLSGTDYPVYEIDHLTCKARVALHGAQVMSWRPQGEEEVLYLSPDAVYREGKAIRGGIPICWPWFNAHPTDPDAPSHGIARTRFWEMIGAEEDEDGVTLRFEMEDGLWKSEVTVEAGLDLVVSMETLNASEIPIVVSGALHSYFSVSDIANVRVVNLEDTEFHNTVGEPTMRKQKGAISFGGEVDAIYDSAGKVLLVDDISGRTILIEKGGSPSTVVWNPWAEKAAAMGDMPDDGFRKFCCIEAAIANDKAVVVMPGSSHVLSTRISVEE